MAAPLFSFSNFGWPSAAGGMGADVLEEIGDGDPEAGQVRFTTSSGTRILGNGVTVARLTLDQLV